jgi:flagellar basal-body rod modification protein FlgD
MVDPVGSVAGTGAAAVPAAADHTSGVGQLGSDAFLKLLVAQLKYQNPLEPANGTEFLQQTAQFSTVEALQNIAESQQQLMGMQQVSLALGMVGQEVTALGGDGYQIRGTVDAVRFVADGPVLTIDGLEVPFTDVLGVEEPAAAVYQAPAPDPEPEGAADGSADESVSETTATDATT